MNTIYCLYRFIFFDLYVSRKISIYLRDELDIRQRLIGDGFGNEKRKEQGNCG